MNVVSSRVPGPLRHSGQHSWWEGPCNRGIPTYVAGNEPQLESVKISLKKKWWTTLEFKGCRGKGNTLSSLVTCGARVHLTSTFTFLSMCEKSQVFRNSVSLKVPRLSGRRWMGRWERIHSLRIAGGHIWKGLKGYLAQMSVSYFSSQGGIARSDCVLSVTEIPPLL